MKTLLIPLIIIEATSVVSALAMEQQAIQEPETASIMEMLPEELKYHIASFVSQASSVQEIMNQLNTLRLVNREFAAIANDELLKKELIRAYVRSNPEKAKNEFLQAAKMGDLKIVKALVDYGQFDVNAKNAKGMDYTGLMYAADTNEPDARDDERGKMAVITFLLSKGADVNAAATTGDTALIVAAVRGNKEIVNLLLNAGANIDAQTIGGYTALMFAARHKDRPMITLLRLRGADENIVDQWGNSARFLLERMHENGSNER